MKLKFHLKSWTICAIIHSLNNLRGCSEKTSIEAQSKIVPYLAYASPRLHPSSFNPSLLPLSGVCFYWATIEALPDSPWAPFRWKFQDFPAQLSKRVFYEVMNFDEFWMNFDKVSKLNYTKLPGQHSLMHDKHDKLSLKIFHNKIHIKTKLPKKCPPLAPRNIWSSHLCVQTFATLAKNCFSLMAANFLLFCNETRELCHLARSSMRCDTKQKWISRVFPPP